MRQPFKLITTDDPNTTLGEGTIRHYPTLIAAANAFAKDDAPFRQIIYDDGECARELSPREEQFLEDVCGVLGFDVEQFDAAA